MRRCLAPDTVDREGGDCADPTCRAHDVNEDGPYPPAARMPCGCPANARAHTCTRNPDHDTACRCSGCLADPYVDPAGPARLEGDFGHHLREDCPDRGCCVLHAIT